MFESIKNIFKKNKKRDLLKSNSKDKAKERLHLVLMQDRANVSADFLDLMRREIIEVIKKYIDIDEAAMDVRLTTQTDEDGVQTAPALYANIPIINIKDETRKLSKTNQENKISTEPPKIDEKKEEQKNKKIEEKQKNEENVNKESGTKDKDENKANQENKNAQENEKSKNYNDSENSNPQPENSNNETNENIKKVEEENKNEK